MSHDDFEIEAVPGLPGRLPEGESLLWQGRPAWESIAIDVLHVRKVLGYFALLGTWSVFEAARNDASIPELLARLPGLLLAATLAAAILVGLSIAIARTTIYSITSARVVLRIGVALPLSINLPFERVSSAGLRLRRSACGDIVLQLTPEARVGFVVLWPHVRPWRFAKPQPLLRGVPDAESVARLLSAALKRSAGPGGFEPSAPATKAAEAARPSDVAPSGAAASAGA